MSDQSSSPSPSSSSSSSSSLPPTARSRTDTLRAELATGTGLLLCLDFDGTLAPIVDDPDDATMPDQVRSQLETIADRPHVTVAVVSGRELADLTERVDIDGITYAGNHGLELCWNKDDNKTEVVHPDAIRHRDALDAICDRIDAELTAIPGTRLERKTITATVHYRQTPPEYTSDVESIVHSIVDNETATAAEDRQLQVVDGKQILEVRPAIPWDKGHAVGLIADKTPPEWQTMYVGDDTTDEDAFEAIEPHGISMVIGNNNGTAASYRIPEQSDVGWLLDWLDEVVSDA